MSFRIAKKDRELALEWAASLVDALQEGEPGPFLTFAEYKRTVGYMQRARSRDPGGDLTL